ncbi:MAG: alpha/beta hydrolase, partial [Congregibacter sp.]|nr:alpha/beta hydrolase [Congregibacter sp.]
ALVVADIAPVAYAASHDAVFAAIAAVDTARPESRSQAVTLMSEYVSDPGVAQFLSLSLKRESDGTYTWRFNAAALRANYGKFRAAPVGSVYRGPTLFVYGLNSTYVDDEGRARALELFPQLQFEGIADTGHWLHAEKPQEFNGAVRGFLKQSLDAQEHQA